ncbi:unnamed protein product [Spodoptera exigua]|nr:unnamed protein product [Spodoptera exigua]
MQARVSFHIYRAVGWWTKQQKLDGVNDLVHLSIVQPPSLARYLTLIIHIYGEGNQCGGTRESRLVIAGSRSAEIAQKAKSEGTGFTVTHESNEANKQTDHLMVSDQRTLWTPATPEESQDLIFEAHRNQD